SSRSACGGVFTRSEAKSASPLAPDAAGLALVEHILQLLALGLRRRLHSLRSKERFSARSRRRRPRARRTHLTTPRARLAAASPLAPKQRALLRSLQTPPASRSSNTSYNSSRSACGGVSTRSEAKSASPLAPDAAGLALVEHILQLLAL